ncbi:MAG TPA: hypothetical protein VF407_21525 [Polyangiaceae bacterium]
MAGVADAAAAVDPDAAGAALVAADAEAFALDAAFGDAALPVVAGAACWASAPTDTATHNKNARPVAP